MKQGEASTLLAAPLLEEPAHIADVSIFVSADSVTCTAGIGTFIVEFGALSRLTGDPVYEEVAVNAIYALRKHVSHIGLYGNHIDVQTGRWTGEQTCEDEISPTPIERE